MPVALGGARDAAALRAQLLPGLRGRVPQPGPERRAARRPPSGGPAALLLPAVPEALPAAGRRRRYPAAQHCPGRGGEAAQGWSAAWRRGWRGGEGRGRSGPFAAGRAGRRLPEASRPGLAALLPAVPPRGVRAVRVRGALQRLPRRQPRRHGLPGGESKGAAALPFPSHPIHNPK